MKNKVHFQKNKFQNKNNKLISKKCNICSSMFFAKSKFQRFCASCRLASEVYRMAEWLPTTHCWV